MQLTSDAVQKGIGKDTSVVTITIEEKLNADETLEEIELKCTNHFKPKAYQKEELVIMCHKRNNMSVSDTKNHIMD